MSPLRLGGGFEVLPPHPPCLLTPRVPSPRHPRSVAFLRAAPGGAKGRGKELRGCTGAEQPQERARPLPEKSGLRRGISPGRGSASRAGPAAGCRCPGLAGSNPAVLLPAASGGRKGPAQNAALPSS